MADNITIFKDTMNIFENGSYYKNNQLITLSTDEEQRQQSIVLLPDDVNRISSNFNSEIPSIQGKCRYEVQNMDSLHMAARQYMEFGDTFDENENEVLVLNFANPLYPGGGVRRGASAQEEDLCRRSSLILSLETTKSMKFYAYNSALKSYLASDAMIISPKVEVIKDNKYNLLDKTFTVAVLTCAAPMITFGLEGKKEPEYEAMVFTRIEHMIQVAIHYNYRHLVLGAWGCGAFRNDARMIAELFCKEFTYLRMRNKSNMDYFSKVDFAVLDKTDGQYNYKEFKKMFSNFN